MATHEITMLNNLIGENSDVFPEPYSVKDTGAVIVPEVWIFNNSGNVDGLAGLFQVPQNYVGTAKVNVYWNANATSGSCTWDLSYLTRSSGEDMGAAATDTTDTVSTTTNATAFNLNKSTMTITSADFAAGDLVPFEIFRDSATDTLAVPAIMWSVTFEYDDA